MRSVLMGDRQPTDDNPNGLSRFEREARHERRMSRVFYVISALALACYLCALKADYDESMAVIDACKHDTSWKCMDKAREDYRRGR